MMKNRKRLVRYGCPRRKWAACLMSVLILAGSICLTAFGEPLERGDAEETSGRSIDYDGYKLEQVIVLSRHNIRSPLSTGGSVLGEITPHKWFEWTSAPSELSLKGGILETEMGQYYRKWLESEGLIPENYRPEEGKVRFYANSKQRTIATAEYFSSGMLPVANPDIEYHMEFDTMDPVFTPQLTFVSDDYVRDAEKEINEIFGDKIKELADNYRLLSNVLDVRASEMWGSGEFKGFAVDDTEYVLEELAEPGMKGSLKTACSASDALVLQYYEESGSKQAAFGHDISAEQWEKIGEIKDLYGDVLFTAPDIAVNVANPLIKEILSEMETPGREFTFLCGHDSNIGSVLAALGAEDYELPDTIEKKTPIGCKLTFSKWVNPAGEEFWSVDLVYQTTGQLMNNTPLNLNEPPEIYGISFKDIRRNPDRLYSADDIRSIIQRALDGFDDLEEKYCQEKAA